MPALSDTRWANEQDPSHQIFVFRAVGGTTVVVDWPSALMPYLGIKGVETFFSPGNKSQVFICPSDRWQTLPADPATPFGPNGPGFVMFNNVVPYNGKFPISYGVNADIGAQVGNDQVGHFGVSDVMNVYGAPRPKGTGNPLGARFYKVHRSAETLLIADCGTRPNAGGESITTGLDRNDAVYYTTNWNTLGGSLRDIEFTDWLRRRVPWERHKDKINIAFCDGHGETVLKGDTKRVRVSPYKWEK
jgi:prepilin-type processing-associated H-X9-DG protein